MNINSISILPEKRWNAYNSAGGSGCLGASYSLDAIIPLLPQNHSSPRYASNSLLSTITISLDTKSVHCDHLGYTHLGDFPFEWIMHFDGVDLIEKFNTMITFCCTTAVKKTENWLAGECGNLALMGRIPFTCSDDPFQEFEYAREFFQKHPEFIMHSTHDINSSESLDRLRTCIIFNVHCHNSHEKRLKLPKTLREEDLRHFIDIIPVFSTFLTEEPR